MSYEKKSPNVGWWAGQLDEIADEIARLCTICNVKILEPGVMARVIKGDDSVCGTSNPKAFEKLRTVVGIHYAVRDKSSERVGEDKTRHAIEAIVARIIEKYGDRFGRPE